MMLLTYLFHERFPFYFRFRIKNQNFDESFFPFYSKITCSFNIFLLQKRSKSRIFLFVHCVYIKCNIYLLRNSLQHSESFIIELSLFTKEDKFKKKFFVKASNNNFTADQTCYFIPSIENIYNRFDSVCVTTAIVYLLQSFCSQESIPRIDIEF